ncbi:STAS domain-containing protein [Nocardia jejuensis]|uniref:STAS domain-containing protein n=1 Tax=Nocardia jejuensis TaxID=328049 RepID=UPI0008305833|nr:STAS domain-containing protein [Nocardia jejuensis]
MIADGHAADLNLRLDSVGGAAVLTVAGEIDMVSAPRLRDAVDGALLGAPTRLVMDLTEVGFLGSAGLSVLLTASEAAPGGLRVVLSRQAFRPIEVTGLDQVLAIFESVDAALSAA